MPPTEPKVLADLLEVSQTLASSLDIRSALGRVLEHIEQTMGALGATVALREGDAGDLTVEAAVGALGVALPHRKDRKYDQEAARLSIVGAMLGQAVRVHRLIEAERERLVEENTKLRHELKEKYQIRSLIGNSRPMQQLYEQVAQ